MAEPNINVRGPFYAGAIQFHDNTIQTNLCVRNILWPAPPHPPQSANTNLHLCREPDRTRALVSFRNSSAGSMIIFNPVIKRPQATNSSSHDRQVADNPKDICAHLVTVHTISTRTLVVDLSAPPKIEEPGSSPFHLDMDGLTFERVHNADITCFFYGQPERVAAQSQQNSTPADRPARPPHFRYPEPAQILGWLRLNSAPSSQVFGAFADALQRSGVGSTSLRIERNWQDIQRTYIGMTEHDGGLWSYLIGNSPAGGTFISNAHSFLANRIWAAHGYLTNFGYNPEYVILPCLSLILLVWAVQFFAFKIRAAEVETPSKYISIGPLFILDRFVPLYKLREEHTKIRRYLTRKPSQDEDVEALIVSRRKVQYFDRLLVVLKIVGVFAAVFLAAAIGSLVAR